MGSTQTSSVGLADNTGIPNPSVLLKTRTRETTRVRETKDMGRKGLTPGGKGTISVPNPILGKGTPKGIPHGQGKLQRKG